jgi:hypothetical protein
MRTLLALTLFTVACTDVPFNGPGYDSVRERLSDAPASLYVHDETSSGEVTARRRGSDEWIVGTTDLTIEHGYVRAAIDRNDQLAIDKLELAVGPINLDGVFQKPTQLTDVRLRLAEPVRSEPTWASADDVTATLSLTFDLDWSIVIDGGEPYPLATQQLKLDGAEVVITGDGGHVDAWLGLEAAGVLWNWADIVQIIELKLSLGAETAD